MATLLLKNATLLVTMDAQRREIAGGALFARDGVIEAVGAGTELPATAGKARAPSSRARAVAREAAPGVTCIMGRAPSGGDRRHASADV